MRIVSNFDGGNIELLGEDEVSAEVAIREDSQAEFRQWFSFQVQARRRGEAGTVTIVNAGDCTYPDAWEGYRACISQDGRRWTRAETDFDGDQLTITLPTARSERGILHCAYFAPYTLARHAQLVEKGVRAPHVFMRDLGVTVEGRNMDLFVVGDPEAEAKRKVWIIGRQHPGETQAEWFLEGVLEKLFAVDDPLVAALLEKVTFYLVPNMNPDGSFLGNLRTNAMGANLNRVWLEPRATESPEVLAVRNAMEDIGVDLFLDVHADERNPYCFLAGCEGNPGYTERLRGLENLFEQSLVAFDEDFQDEYGYDRDEPGGGDLSTAGNWVGERFDCLSFTVEMPFKDAANHPDPERGWTPERAKLLGASSLESILVSADELR